MNPWRLSNRFDVKALPLADRHYNRQKIGSPQFVPPGRCVVLIADDALWVTSWQLAEYTRHAWPGAWVNSLFRKETSGLASDYILAAIATTRAIWNPPAQGLISFVNPRHVRGVKRRGRMVYGYCYLMSGFKHVGFTSGGLWVWHLAPAAMPAPDFSVMTPLFPKLVLGNLGSYEG